MAKAKTKTKKAGGKKAKAKPAPRTAKASKSKTATPGWIDAGKGYELSIVDGKLVARKDDKQLGSVPKPVKSTPIADKLNSAIDFLDDHELDCKHTVETWMLRSLPVPRGVLQAVIADDAWAAALKEVWVVAVKPDGSVDREVGGFFRGVDKDKGIGVVDRDGETTWLATESVLVPHPILLDELDDLRQMAVEIGVSQGTSQLFRETFTRPAVPPPDGDAFNIDQFSGGEFAMIQMVTGLSKRLGYRVSGGNAVCRVLEHGRFVEARYELGDGDGYDETTTGELSWVDDKQRPIALVEVPHVAFSEGMRMASQIYAKRKVEKEGSDD
jgi:hypothetical protein